MNCIAFVLLLAQTAVAIVIKHQEVMHKEKELLVMVRTYNPMPGMLARMREFSDDLYTNLPHAQFMVSVDATHYNRTSEISSAVPKAIVQDYTWDDVLSGYPVLSEMTIASAYDFHMEPILLAVNYSRTHARTSQNASVWVIEDDVFLCGGTISDFISLYGDVNSDFLSVSFDDTDEWFWRDYGSSKFLQAFSPELRRKSNEHVQRFSSTFLAHLEKESRLSNMTAQSEMLAPTECWNHKDAFRCETFDSKHVGEYDWWRHMDEATANATCQAAKNITINHAGKFVAPSDD